MAGQVRHVTARLHFTEYIHHFVDVRRLIEFKLWISFCRERGGTQSHSWYAWHTNRVQPDIGFNWLYSTVAGRGDRGSPYERSDRRKHGFGNRCTRAQVGCQWVVWGSEWSVALHPVVA